MDEILERFETTLGTSQAEVEQSHKDLYKNWGKYGNQDERRTEILRQQKSNRENKLDNCRGILDLMDYAENKSSVFKTSYRNSYQPTVYVPGFNNTSNFYYNNVLMHSEWLVEKPEDFDTNWFVAPCPKGTRVLVIACDGTTRCYTKYGQLVQTAASVLPGGNGNEKRKNCSVLDCFYCKDINTMYVLDVLSWKNHVMADGQMEFRRYWLESVFQEHPEMGIVNKKNRISFKLLPMISCDMDSLQKFMMTYPPLESGKLDGLLFYHKHASYVAGETPLVGWLYPYMVPEVLYPDIKIHEIYAAEKPEDYVNQATFIQKFEEKIKKKAPFKKWRKKTQSTSETSMEAEDAPVEQNDSEKDITEQTVNGNATISNGDSATMETENIQNGDSEVVETENGEIEVANVVNEESGHIPTQTTSLFSDQDSPQQPAPITKYYSHFN